MFIAKLHSSNKSNVLAIIDKELLGKEITKGNRILDLKNSFYKGEEVKEENLMKLISKADHLNVVGEKIISFLKKKKIIEKIQTIGSVPCAQTIIIKD